MRRTFEKLVKIRKDREKNLRLELAKVMAERMAKEAELEADRENYKKSSEIFLGLLAEGTLAQNLAYMLLCINGARGKIEEDEKAVKELWKMEEGKRGEVLEAKREREIAEKLFEKVRRREEVLKEKRLERELDDLVSRKR